MTQTVIPQLRIISAEKSLPFYVQGLGFEIDWQHQFEPGFPLFFSLTRDCQTIFLTEHSGDCHVGGAIYFLAPDVDNCYSNFLANGIAVVRPPEDMPWEMREMIVMDPDGNRLRFASDAP